MEQKKIFYSMGEVAEMFDVNASLIRHWEGQFDIIKPTRNKKGNRLFTAQDVENFKLIYHLVKERRMTLEGAKKALKKGSIVKGSSINRDVLIVERLQNLRSLLVEVRDLLKEGEEEMVAISIDQLEIAEDNHDNDTKPDEQPPYYEQSLF
ncbi:MAG: MerR family transcriptional regulator [Rikenellaceae bacterium]